MSTASRIFERRHRFATGGAGVAACISLLTGCTVGPDFTPPTTDTAPAWKHLAAESGTIPGEWWTLFNDAALNDLVAESLRENQDLKIAFARVEQARAIARQSAADFYPEISSEPSFNRERFSANRPTAPRAVRGPYTASTYAVPFDLSYEIDIWGRVRRSYEAAAAAADASELDREGMRLTVTGDVARTYFSIRFLDAEEQVLQEAVDLRNKAVEIVNGRFTGGVGNEIDLARAQTELATAEAELRGVRRQRAALENALAVLCGKQPSSFTLPVLADPVAEITVPAGLPSELLVRRPDIAASMARMQEANARVGVATAAFYPSFSLTGSAGFVSADLASVFDASSRVWSFGPSMFVPIFEGGRNEARKLEAEALYREREASYRQTLLVAFREVEDSLSALGELKGEIDFQIQAQRAADRTFELANGRFRQGLVTYLDVVDAARSQLDSRRASVRLQGLQAETTVMLIKSLGGGWRDDESDAVMATPQPEQTQP